MSDPTVVLAWVGCITALALTCLVSWLVYCLDRERETSDALRLDLVRAQLRQGMVAGHLRAVGSALRGDERGGDAA